jgi:hypothetical protein
VAPLAQSARHAAELLPPLYDLAKQLLVNQWGAFVDKAPTEWNAPHEATFRSEIAAQHFHALMDLIAIGVRGVDLPPHVVQSAVATLRAADAASRLFDLPAFAQRWRAAFADALMDALFERRHDLLADDLAAALHAVAKADMAAFFSAFIPAKLSRLQGLDDAQRGAVLQGWAPAEDLPSFVASVRDAVADVSFHRDRTKTRVQSPE